MNVETEKDKNVEPEKIKESESLRKSNLSETNDTKVKRILIHFGDMNPEKIHNMKFGNNLIQTTRFSPLTYLPLSLFKQLRRATNLYFLLVTVLTCLPYTPKNPGSMMATFLLILFATMIKDGLEDYERYKLDKIANNQEVMKLENRQWVKVPSWTLRPGDIVQIQNNEEFVADILIVKTTSDNGYCFIDSKNLDGESHLKEKMTLENFRNMNETEIKDLRGTIDCPKSDENLFFWEGQISWNKDLINVFLSNIVFKGCTLRNTSSIIGIIVYSGNYTKIMKNSKKIEVKETRVSRIMNRVIYSLFYFDAVICVIFAALSTNFFMSEAKFYPYLFPNFDSTDILNNKIVRLLLALMSYFISYSHVIPISLYVALEFVKIIQGWLIYYDEEIGDENCPAQSRHTDLVEELGMIQYICTDKTGTLTQNKMVLKKIYVNGIVYEDIQDYTPLNGDMRDLLRKGLNSASPDRKIKTDPLTQKKKLEEFLYLLTLCHNLFVEKNKNGEISYHGESADEIALVKGAQQLGVEFKHKEYSEIIVMNNLTNQEKKYEIKNILPFDSERKRMSVIVWDKEAGEYLVLCKGADSELIPRTIFEDEEEEEVVQETIWNFSNDGYRIMVMGRRYLTPAQYENWNTKFKITKSKGKRMERLFDEIEKDFDISGIVAIEDKLQERVPETIKTLTNCGIKIWMLTGDKADTAREVAKNSCIISDATKILTIYCPSKTKIDIVMSKIARDFGIDIDKQIDVNQIMKRIKKRSDNTPVCVIIDGVTLELVLDNYEYSKIFFLLGMSSQSVICCRVSPSQKAKIVKLIKLNGDWITLSIGDGSNDLPMLLESHIGVGLMSVNGGHADRFADFTLGKFKYLEKLLLIYGMNGYIKISRFICYYFYKNVILIFTELYFTSHSGYSTQLYFADYLSTLYNALWTSWPCILTFSFEKKLELTMQRKFPFLYECGTKNQYFNLTTFWTYVLSAFYHGTICFYIVDYGFKDAVSNSGRTLDHWSKSSLCFTMIIHVVNYKLLIITDYWNILNIGGIFISIFCYYFCLFIISTKAGSSFQPEMENVIFELMSTGKFWFFVIFGPFLCLVPDITTKLIYLQTNHNPLNTLVLKVRDPEFIIKLDKELNSRAAAELSVMKKAEEQGAPAKSLFNVKGADIILKKPSKLGNDYGSSYNLVDKKDEIASPNTKKQDLNTQVSGNAMTIKTSEFKKLTTEKNMKSNKSLGSSSAENSNKGENSNPPRDKTDITSASINQYQTDKVPTIQNLKTNDNRESEPAILQEATEIKLFPNEISSIQNSRISERVKESFVIEVQRKKTDDIILKNVNILKDKDVVINQDEFINNNLETKHSCGNFIGNIQKDNEDFVSNDCSDIKALRDNEIFSSNNSPHIHLLNDNLTKQTFNFGSTQNNNNNIEKNKDIQILNYLNGKRAFIE